LEGDTAEDPRLRSALLSETMIAANKLNVVVEDLLAMSRLEAGRLSPHPELAYVSELLGAAQTTLGMEMGGRGILLDESARDSEIEADPVLMVQVFRNILRNFATYTPQGSVLRIEAEAAPGVSVLSSGTTARGWTIGSCAPFRYVLSGFQGARQAGFRPGSVHLPGHRGSPWRLHRGRQEPRRRIARYHQAAEER
jgi:signal transduction histidine kinase